MAPQQPWIGLSKRSRELYKCTILALIEVIQATLVNSHTNIDIAHIHAITDYS